MPTLEQRIAARLHQVTGRNANDGANETRRHIRDLEGRGRMLRRADTVLTCVIGTIETGRDVADTPHNPANL
jgi:hypothetical protein